MKRTNDRLQSQAGLTLDGVFVVKLRSDSNLPRRHVRGSVEHVLSGRSVKFASLQDLLGFMDCHATTKGPRTSATSEVEDPNGQ